MRVTMDDHPCGVDGDSIGSVLSRAAEKAEAAGRIIVEVHVDGVTWGEDELGSEERCGGSAELIELISADRTDLVCTALADAGAALGEIDEMQRSAAESLQVGETATGMQTLGEALELWLLVRRGIGMSLDTVGVSLSDVAHEGEPVEKSVTALEEQLRGVRDALANRDGIALADTLLYELPDVIQHWRRVLDTLQTHVRHLSAAGGVNNAENAAEGGDA